MKKLMFLMAVALMAFLGCQKEDSNLHSSKAAYEKEGASNAFISAVDLDDDFKSLNVIVLDDLKASNDRQLVPRESENISANGHFTSITGNATYSFSAVQNKAGVHGQGNINGPEGGWDLEMKTVCLEVEGNKAVIGGLITRVNHLPSGAEEFFIVGNYIYLYVEDHGEGANAASDRYERRLYWSPAEFGPLCFLIPPSNTAAWGEYIVDVAKESDQVQVKD